MEALAYVSPGKLELRQKPLPEPKEGEALLKIEACGLCGTDSLITATGQGDAPVKAGTTIGHEGIGRIVSINGNPKGYQVGDLVAVSPHFGCGKCIYCLEGDYAHCREFSSFGTTLDGFFAEYAAVRLESLSLLSGRKSPAEYSLIEPLSCVLHAYKTADARKAGKALVYGGGLAGDCFLTLFKLDGIEAHLVEPTPDRRLKALECGAKAAYGDSLDKDLPAAAPFDLVVEASGHLQNIDAAVPLLKPKGTVLLYGIPRTAALPLREMQEKEIRLVTSFLNAGAFEEAKDIVEEGLPALDSFLKPVASLSTIRDILLGKIAPKGHKAVYVPGDK